MSHVFYSLHDQALKLSRRYLACEKELLEILVKIESKKVYLQQGYSSLTEYSQKALGLSRDVSWNLVTIVHKSKAVPELKHAVQMGVLPLSKARQIAPHLTKENSQKFIALAQAMPREKLQEALAKVVTAQAHQCTYQDPRTQLRCDKERFLHIHHKLPVAMGGTNALENLTLLCSSHHRLEHYRSSG